MAAFLRPAGNARPIRSSLSRKNLPPFLDFALEKERNEISSQFKRVNSLVLDEMGRWKCENDRGVRLRNYLPYDLEAN